MRDIKAGRDINVQGPMIVNDNSQEFKLLIHCNNEELLAEEEHRHELFSAEKKAKLNKFLLFLAVAALLIFIAGGWYWFQGDMNLFSFFTGAAGFMVALASIKFYETPSVFEQRQLAALQEIHLLLRERGVRK